MDHFSLFSLPRRLDLDLPALETLFHAKARRLHPDRFASRPEAEQAVALQQSYELNDAYRTLRDPISRTEYLLSLEGNPASVSGTATKAEAPPELLEEAFELNLQLEEMRFAKQAGERDEAVEQDLLSARDRFTKMLADTELELRRLWTEWDQAEAADAANHKAAALQAMAALLNRRSYVRNLVRDVIAALE